MVRNCLFKFQGLRAFALAGILLFAAARGVFADGALQFEALIDTEFPGGAVYTATESFIHPAGDRLHDQRSFKIPADVLNSAVAGILCVTGESARAGADTPAVFSVPVRRMAQYQKRSLETLYHEVYAFDPKKVPMEKSAKGKSTGGGEITVGKILADVVNPTGKYKYSTAAATLIILYKKPDSKLKKIRFFAGLSAPTPGDIYAFSFKRPSDKYRPVSLTIAGGHGIKGNATGNIFCGLTLSGRDDWNSSSGILWDLDKYNLQKWTFDGIINYQFSIDTVLNWIYPEILIFEEEVRL